MVRLLAETMVFKQIEANKNITECAIETDRFGELLKKSHRQKV
jgi:hypothetical protein